MAEKKPQPRKTFRRGPVATVVGLTHTVAGFLALAWAAARIAVIGYHEVLAMGGAMATVAFLFEGHAVLLWISGIGILRGKAWGRYCAAAWAAISLSLHVATYFIQDHFWGIISPGFSWTDYLIMYYAGAVIVVVAGAWALQRLPGWLARRAESESWPFGHDSVMSRLLPIPEKEPSGDKP